MILTDVIKKNIKYINLILFIILTLILLFRPYNFVFFDQEPTYLAEAIHILEWNIPWTSHHPGTIVSYFYSIILKLTIFYDLNLGTTILVLRILSLFIFLSILFISIYFYSNKDINFFIYSLLLIFTIPIINIYLSHFGIEAFVFAFSFLIWLCGFNFLEKKITKIRLFLLSFFIGISLSIKFSSIILLFICFFLIFLQKINFFKKILLSIFSLFISFFTFFLLTIPAIRYYPKLFNKINREVNIEFFLSNILIIFFIIFIFFLIVIYNDFITKYLNKLKSRIFTIFLPIFFIIFILFYYLKSCYYSPNEGLGNFYYTMPLLRNFIPIFPLFVIILYKFKFKLSNLSLFLIFIFNIFLIYNFSYESSKIDNFVESRKNQNFIVISNSTFNSKYIFLDYANKRYGNGSIIFPKAWNKYINLSIIESDMFNAWLDRIDIIRDKNLDEAPKTLSKQNRFNFVMFFKVINYSENKFNIFSLSRPPHKQRIIQSDYCDQIIGKNIIFEKDNNQHYITLTNFEKKLDKLTKYCNISNIETLNLNYFTIYTLNGKID